MEEMINKAMMLEKVNRKLNILLSLLSENEPNYELKLMGDYEAISIDSEIALQSIRSMVKKYSKVRKELLKEFKSEVRKLK